MHMHRAADLVTSAPVCLKKAPRIFFFAAAGHNLEAACGMLCRQKVDLCNGFSCITAIKSIA